MIPNDPQNWTIANLSKAIREKEVSPIEITKAFLSRIKEFDPKINSFITVLEKQALKAARQAESEICRGKYRGPLHGIPYAPKDLFFTKGILTTCGSKILKKFRPSFNATAIQKLSEAGAIMIGKLNMHEFAYGTNSTNPHFGPVRNPWDTERIPGGSSGGSGAALAASFVPLTLGTDTGGSIRIPSALCGVAGLKPTFGRISKYGVYPLCHSLDHPGPMARSVLDLALAMNILAGYDPQDPTTSMKPVPNYAKGLSPNLNGIRLGIPKDYYFDRLDSEVGSAIQEAVHQLKKLGAQVKLVAIPFLEEAAAAAAILLMSEAAATLEEYLLTRPQDLGKDVRSRLNVGTMVRVTQYLRAQRFRKKIQGHFADAFEKVDCLITPQLPITAPKIGQSQVSIEKAEETVPSALTRFTRIYNLIGIPSLSIPCGFSSEGLPIGLQIAGRPFAEGMVLKVGHAYEMTTSWKDRHPLLAEG
jgi:aspartyl-tRNA(Asn)/glutamyl-tRNA(Gln) amidotransferase subunit A